MDVRAHSLLAQQDGVVARWQLADAGLSREVIQTLSRGWVRAHDGVYIATYGRPSAEQLWRAATLSAPGSVLHRHSAAACWEIRPNPGCFEWVVRPGTRGPQDSAGAQGVRRLIVAYSTTLDDDAVTDHRGIPITTAPRTIIDLAAVIPPYELRKLLREALRLKRVTVASIRAALDRHPGARGTGELRRLVAIYERLQLERCDSDAEAAAMETLNRARRPLPDVNTTIAGHRADLSWPAERLIIELDGPQFHRDKLYDAHKTRLWTAAGWRVRSVESDDVFERPERLLDLTPRRRRAGRPGR